jgi:SAM-dependent methyltransferase
MTLKTKLRRVLELTGQIGPYYRWREARLAAVAGEAVDDGLPMPPAALITLISSTAGQRWYSERGREDAAQFRALALEQGLDLTQARTVLDWGVGCGRIARWLAADVTASGGQFLGVDIHPKLVAWCAAALPGRYLRNGLRPPLPLEAASLDLVYSHSVLTHLTEDTARAWLAELHRLLKPGGCAILTFHDETFAAHWGPPEVRARLATQDYVVWNNALEGSNYMSAWTSRAYFRQLAAAGFTVAKIVEGGAGFPSQAIAVLRPKP